MLDQGNKNHYLHYLFIVLTKDSLHTLFLSPGLVKAEPD